MKMPYTLGLILMQILPFAVVLPIACFVKKKDTCVPQFAVVESPGISHMNLEACSWLLL